MNILEPTREWLRGCPLIGQNNKFNANYLGARPVEYSVALSSVTHSEDIIGRDIIRGSVVFYARMPYGDALAANVSAAEFFAGLDEWVWAQNRAHKYPTVEGYDVTKVTAANAGLLVSADAKTAEYQIQITVTAEEA